MESEKSNLVRLCPHYAGVCEHTPLTNEDLLSLTNQRGQVIHGPTLFALHYRLLPCTMVESDGTSNEYNDLYTYNMYGGFSALKRGRRWNEKHKQGGMYHATSVLRFLVNEYKIDPDTFIFDSSYNIAEKDSRMNDVYINLGNYLAVRFSDRCVSPVNVNNPNNLEADQEKNIFNCFLAIQIFHVPQQAKEARMLLQELSKFKLFPVTEGILQMICHDAQYGFYTSSMRMTKPHITDLKLHYGDDFIDIHEELLETLQEKNSTGITLLHGPPGTGKTYYLRYLINEIQDKSLIYIQPDLVSDMMTPGYLPFLMQHPNSILIVEDAENIIRDRQQDSSVSNQAVVNLLNLSDGLLGNVMHQQIICTFNCDVKGIDPALLRDGRLVIEHKFDKLSAEHARRLCKELAIPGNGDDIHESISLAEIYARKNAATEISTTDLENTGNSKERRKSKKKNKQPDSFFGLYS